MKELIKIAFLFLAGLLVASSASAYYVSGGVVYDSNGDQAEGTYTYGAAGYEGYIGNVNLGLPDPGSLEPWIGTYALVTNPADLGSMGSYVLNPAATLSAGGDVDWYKFSVDVLSGVGAYFEWNDGVQSFKITYYLESELYDNVFYEREYTSAEIANGYLEQLDFKDFPPGEYLMKIEGSGTAGGSNGYRVRVVPLPPAALLLVSAVAGFGVLGRRKKGNAA